MERLAEGLDTKPEGSFVDQAVVEPELKDTTENSLKTTAKGPRRRRRRLAGW